MSIHIHQEGEGTDKQIEIRFTGPGAIKIGDSISFGMPVELTVVGKGKNGLVFLMEKTESADHITDNKN